MIKLEEFITLEQAAEKYNLDKALLTELAEAGRIKAGRLDGIIVLAEGDVRRYSLQRRKIEVLREKYSHLAGTPISIYEAARKYGLHPRSIWKWAVKDKLITVLDQGWGMKVDERDVAVVHELSKSGELRKGRALAHIMR